MAGGVPNINSKRSRVPRVVANTLRTIAVRLRTPADPREKSASHLDAIADYLDGKKSLGEIRGLFK